MKERSHFDLFYGLHFDIDQTLKEIGFTQVKKWMLPINFMFRDGKEYMANMGAGRVKGVATANGWDETKTQQGGNIDKDIMHIKIDLDSKNNYNNESKNNSNDDLNLIDNFELQELEL